jgi:hypothetical protein
MMLSNNLRPAPEGDKFVLSKTFIALVRVSLVAVLLGGPAYSGSPQEVVTPEQFTQDFDYLWSQLRDHYAYFDKKETDWALVREVYRPRAAEVRTKREFVAFLERVLEELYDNHPHLKVNTGSSPRLIPTGLDVWAEWEGGKAIVTQLRKVLVQTVSQADNQRHASASSSRTVPVSRSPL